MKIYKSIRDSVQNFHRAYASLGRGSRPRRAGSRRRWAPASRCRRQLHAAGGKLSSRHGKNWSTFSFLSSISFNLKFIMHSCPQAAPSLPMHGAPRLPGSAGRRPWRSTPRRPRPVEQQGRPRSPPLRSSKVDIINSSFLVI